MVARSESDGRRDSWYVEPDPSSTAPGRGAHLHPVDTCLALAERRRAFTRALRHDAEELGPLRLDRVREHLGAASERRS